MYFELLKRFGGKGETLPLLDPIEDMEIEDQLLKQYSEARCSIEQQLKSDTYSKITNAQQE